MKKIVRIDSPDTAMALDDLLLKLEEIVELVQMARHDVKTAHEQFLKDTE